MRMPKCARRNRRSSVVDRAYCGNDPGDPPRKPIRSRWLWRGRITVVNDIGARTAGPSDPLGAALADDRGWRWRARMTTADRWRLQA